MLFYLTGTSPIQGKAYAVSFDGKVAISIHPTSANFVTGLSVLFASYYVFNIEYEANASLTLEFIQR
jgi:hypothetical protein